MCTNFLAVGKGVLGDCNFDEFVVFNGEIVGTKKFHSA